jgi:uncharacterized protein (DUF362 family)
MAIAPEISGAAAPPATNRALVAVVKTNPGAVLDDVASAMRAAGAAELLSPGVRTGLKINISWQVYYPGCSTTPWQLDGVIQALLGLGHRPNDLVGIQSRTVVVDSRIGEVKNKQLPVLKKWRVPTVHTHDREIEWVRYEPHGRMRVLDQVFPDGIFIPRFFHGINMVHLPTMKTHVFTTTTGAMKNAIGGLLPDNRHWTHGVIHDTLVDLLQIQKEIHPQVFAVMDGTIAGDGPGPRAMMPHVKNFLLASADQVAIDAVAAKMMGFDPLTIRYIRLAHEAGLGCGDVREIQVVGEDVADVDFGFRATQTAASRGQRMIYHGPLRRLERPLLRSPIVPWAYAASRLYHDTFWYPLIGKRRIEGIMQTEWGRLFQQY